MHSPLLLVGTHRRPHRADPEDLAFGLYSFRRDLQTAAWVPAGMAPTPQPGWFAVHSAARFVYAVNEVTDFEGEGQGGISAFALDQETGRLTPLNSRLVGANPCHCAVDDTGTLLLVATHRGATLHMFPLGSDGRIGEESCQVQRTGSSQHPKRQNQPHPHQVVMVPGSRFVLVPDLGTDELAVYELDPARAQLHERKELTVAVAPGSGPRHVALAPDAKKVYLINELSATVMVFDFDPQAARLQQVQVVDLLPVGFRGQRIGGAIAVHPSGRWLYATTRSHGSSGYLPAPGLDTVVWFAIDPHSGQLVVQGRVESGGEIPRSFVFEASGQHLWVGHQASGNVVNFRIDPENGAPVPSGESLQTPVPVCIGFVAGS